MIYQRGEKPEKQNWEYLKANYVQGADIYRVRDKLVVELGDGRKLIALRKDVAEDRRTNLRERDEDVKLRADLRRLRYANAKLKNIILALLEKNAQRTVEAPVATLKFAAAYGVWRCNCGHVNREELVKCELCGCEGESEVLEL